MLSIGSSVEKRAWLKRSRQTGTTPKDENRKQAPRPNQEFMEKQWAWGLAIRWQGRRCTNALLGLVLIFDYFIVASGNDL